LALDFAPDRPDVLAAHTGGVVSGWDGATGTELFSFRPHPKSKAVGRICTVRFFKDGRRFLTGGDDQTVKLWDGPGAEARTFRGHTGEVYTAVLSADERRLATASEDGTVRVWDVDTGTELLVLRGHRRAVYGVAFSPDGTRLASVGQDRTIRIWDGTPVAPAEAVGHQSK
jgi:WD40 repeat protein